MAGAASSAGAAARIARRGKCSLVIVSSMDVYCRQECRKRQPASTNALSHPYFLVGRTANDSPHPAGFTPQIVAGAKVPCRAALGSLDGPGDIGDGMVLALQQHLLDCKMGTAESALRVERHQLGHRLQKGFAGRPEGRLALHEKTRHRDVPRDGCRVGIVIGIPIAGEEALD